MDARGFLETRIGIEFSCADVREGIRDLVKKRRLKRKGDEENRATEQVEVAIEIAKRRWFHHRVKLSKPMERARLHGGNVLLMRTYRLRRMNARRIQWAKKWEQRRTSSEYTENRSCDGVDGMSGEKGDDEIPLVC